MGIGRCSAAACLVSPSTTGRRRSPADTGLPVSRARRAYGDKRWIEDPHPVALRLPTPAIDECAPASCGGLRRMDPRAGCRGARATVVSATDNALLPASSPAGAGHPLRATTGNSPSTSDRLHRRAEANKQRCCCLPGAWPDAPFLDFDPTPYVGFRVMVTFPGLSYARISPALIEPGHRPTSSISIPTSVGLDAIDPTARHRHRRQPDRRHPATLHRPQKELGIPPDKPYVNAGV